MKADKIFKNGRIYTMNDNRDWAESIAIADGKIVYVGEDKGIEKFIDNRTEVIDLKRKMMLPGFYDGHCHIALAAYLMSGVYLEIEYSIDECVEAIKNYVEENPEKEAYFGLGYAEWLFDEKGPRKEVLDKICASKPMMILGSSGHEAWVNSKTLELANITEKTPDPIPGLQYFERDEKGTPTGHIVETGAEVYVMEKINFFNEETIRKSIPEISRGYAEMGVTSVADMGIFMYLQDASISVLDTFTSNGEFVQRVTGCGGYVDNQQDFEGQIEKLAELKKRYNNDRYRINFLKIINDGTIESRSAAMSEPYTEDGSVVNVMVGGSKLADIGLKAAESGLDIRIHAIGDSAARETINMAKVLRKAGFNDTRITNEHTDYVRPEDRPLFGKYDVIANTTTVWHYGNPDMERVIGERADDTFTLKSCIDGGAMLCLGSDYPVDEYGREPLKGIEMGVTRQLFDKPDAPVLKPESEKLSIDDCIAGYTRNAAYQVRMEDKLGTIEAGKYADLVILEQDIFQVPVNEIHNVKVCETIIEGKTVFKA